MILIKYDKSINFYDFFPIEIIELILIKIDEIRDFKTTISCRSVCHHWHSYFKTVNEYDITKKTKIRTHVFNKNYFKTYKSPMLNLEKIIYFRKYGKSKYIKYNSFGRVICVIKSDGMKNIERMYLNNSINKIIKKKYDVVNDLMNTQILEINTVNLEELQKEDENNSLFTVNYFNNPLVYPNNCVIF